MFPVKLCTLASEGSLQEILDFLEGNFTYWGNVALCHAAMCGRLEIVKGLLEAGVSIDSDGRNEVIISAAGSYVEQNDVLLQFLLERGANIEALGSHNRTALSSAAEAQNFQNVRFLIEHGANINHQDVRGRTALFYAVEADNFPIVQYLCKAGAETNIKDNRGNTCLLEASQWGLNSIIETLVAHGANLHFLKRRRSALRNALQKKQMETARLLIKLGANIDEIDHTGTSTLEWAQEKAYTFIVEEILKLHSEAATILQ